MRTVARPLSGTPCCLIRFGWAPPLRDRPPASPTLPPGPRRSRARQRLGASALVAAVAALSWPGVAPAEPGTPSRAPLATQATANVRQHFERMIEAALAASPRVLGLKLTAQGRDADVGAEAAAGLPRPSAAVARGDGFSSVELRLTQTLLDGGRVASRVAGAAARLAAAEQQVRAAGREVALEVVEAWRAWASAHEQIRAAGQSLERLRRYADSARARHEAGMAGDAELGLVRARLTQSEIDHLSLGAARESARIRLQSLGVGLIPDHGPGWLASGLPGQAVEHRSIDAIDAIDAIVAQAPAVARLRFERAASQAELDELRASRWPVLNAVYGLQRGTTASGPFRDSRVSVQFEYAPAAADLLGHRLASARSRVAAAESDVQAATLEARKALSIELESMRALDRQLPLQASAVREAQGVLESFERQFLAGRRSWLEVVNSERDLALAEGTAARVAADLVASHGRVLVVAGELDLTRGRP